nr:hypothetical protein [uncultured bacterium]
MYLLSTLYFKIAAARSYATRDFLETRHLKLFSHATNISRGFDH